MNPNLSSAQFKTRARRAVLDAREHRQDGNLNAADEALRFAAVYREKALYGVKPNGAANSPNLLGGKTTWRYGDTPTERVLP